MCRQSTTGPLGEAILEIAARAGRATQGCGSDTVSLRFRFCTQVGAIVMIVRQTPFFDGRWSGFRECPGDEKIHPRPAIAVASVFWVPDADTDLSVPVAPVDGM